MSVEFPIPPQIVNPVLEAKVAQDFQNIFKNNLTWLENSYALVRTGVHGLSEQKEWRYPQVYAGLSGKPAEYYDLQPNDKLRSFSFIDIEGPYDFDPVEESVTFDMSATFWVNLAKIDGRNYDYTSELISNVLRYMRKNQIYDSRIKDIRVEKRPELIFNKYSFEQKATQFLMYPYGAFKIFFKITDDADCLADLVATNPNSCSQ